MNDSQCPPTKPVNVTIEDLLRLKRAEKPPVEFWTEFERQMRTKQLAAIVRKDPWWASWLGVLGGAARFRMPLGAAAMLAFTFVTVREYNKPSSSAPSTPSSALRAVAVSPVVSAVRQEAPQPAVEVPTESALVAEQMDAAEAAPDSRVVAIQEHAAPETYVAATPADANRIRDIQAELVGLSPGPARSSNGSVTPSARFIAANLAAAERSDPELMQNLVRTASFEVSDKSSSVEPLTQVTTPRDTRRARLLASAVPADLHSPEHSALRSRERITSHLDEQALYDSITRLGVAGNRLSIKF